MTGVLRESCGPDTCARIRLNQADLLKKALAAKEAGIVPTCRGIWHHRGPRSLQARSECQVFGA